jgi:hypothetical protein
VLGLSSLLFANKPLLFQEPFPLKQLGGVQPWTQVKSGPAVLLASKPLDQTFLYSTRSFSVKNLANPLTAEKEFLSEGEVRLSIVGKTNGLPLVRTEGKIRTSVPEFLQTETYSITPQGGIRHFRDGSLSVKVGPLRFDFRYSEHVRSDEFPSVPVFPGTSWRSFEKIRYEDSKGKGEMITSTSNVRIFMGTTVTNGRTLAVIRTFSKTHEYSTIPGGPPRKNRDPNQFSLASGWILFDIKEGRSIKSVVNRIPTSKEIFETADISTFLLPLPPPSDDPLFLTQEIILSK